MTKRRQDGTEKRWLRWAERWYRFLLRVSFPRAFLRNCGEDVALSFRDGARRALRERGRVALLRLCIGGAPRVLLEGLAERWDARTQPLVARGAGGRRRGGSMRTDLTHALRALRANPRYTVAVALTFALGVGINTTVFSFVRGILLRPLPIPSAERIVVVGHDDGFGHTGVTSPAALQAVAESVDALEGVSAFAWAGGILTGQGEPVRVTGAQVGPGYFATIGQPPLLGREFRAGEDGPDAPALVLVSHRMWRDRFGGSPDVIGRILELDGTRREIVGVLRPALVSPHDFAFGDAGDVFVPMTWNAEEHNLGWRVLRAVARLAPGATVERANAELGALSAALTADNPAYGEQRLGVTLVREYYVSGGRETLLLLQAAVLVVLIIGAVNVMNMTLARGIERRHELAVRAALGAGRPVLMRTVMLEVLLAAAIGGVFGVVLAMGLLPVLLSLAPQNLPQLAWVRVDGLTIAGGAVFTLAAALLAGLVPAARLLTDRGVADLTRSGQRGTPGPGHRRFQSSLATVQVGLAVALLVAAGLLIRSFAGLLSVDLGYAPEGVRVLQIDLPADRYATPASRVLFLEQLTERLAGRPEVALASFGSTAPQHGLNNFNGSVGLPGREQEDRSDNPWGFIRAVAPGYLSTLDLDLLQGRPLHRTDHALADAPAEMHLRAALVNAEFARRFLAEEPIGRRLVLWGDTMEIVGVVESTRYAYPGADPEPEIYVPFDGRFSAAHLIVRGHPGAGALVSAIRDEVQRMDAGVPLQRIPALDALVRESLAEARLLLILVGTMATVALAIASVGIYGVLAFLVARRRVEIGIRMALGAGAGQMLGMLLRHGLELVLIGLVLGLALAWAMGRILGGFLYGVGPRDPAVFVAVAIVLGLVGIMASLLPALRAARVDPLQTLREG